MNKRWMMIILVVSSVLSLVSCTYKKGTNPATIDDANAAYSRNAQASGLGEEARFGEQSGHSSRARLANKRVYYFDFDSNVVHEEDQIALQANAKYLSAHPNLRVLLEGHTDPRGSREYNIGLGERRAKAVATILAQRGVDPNQIRIVSYGAEKLAAPGHSESVYQLDRRAVLVYSQR